MLDESLGRLITGVDQLRYGQTYLVLNGGQVRVMDSREVINHDHFEFKADNSKTLYTHGHFYGRIILRNGQHSKAVLGYFLNKKGSLEKFITVYAVSRRSSHSEIEITYKKNGRSSRVGVGSFGKRINEEKENLIRIGYPHSKDVFREIDFESSWKRIYELVRQNKPPTNVIDLLVPKVTIVKRSWTPLSSR